MMNTVSLIAYHDKYFGKIPGPGLAETEHYLRRFTNGTTLLLFSWFKGDLT